VILTYRYRVKDATTAKRLGAHAQAVNCVWNFCGETQEMARRSERPWPSAFDFIRLTTGSSVLLGLHSDTVQAVCKQFVVNRDAAGRRPRWRGKKSLGWIPFASGRAITLAGDSVAYVKRRYRLWHSRPINGKIKAGCFAQDARGRWYLSLIVQIAETRTCGVGEIGVDLGLMTLATLSDGRKIENPRHFKKYHPLLAAAQRAGKRRRVLAIHSRIANARMHYLHVLSAKLARENRLIVVGNVDAKSLPYRSQRKSAIDASWSQFRSQLRYKASRHGGFYIETDETGTSVSCSACGAHSGPKGSSGLRVRAWVCDRCDARHDRDVNAAMNLLLRAERRPPLVESPSMVGEEDVKDAPFV
jgi:putative transposase